MNTYIIIGICIFALYLFITNHFRIVEEKVLRMYKLIMFISKKIDRVVLDAGMAFNNFEYYVDELKKYEGEKKKEIVDKLNENSLIVKKKEERAFQLNKRIININKILNSNFITKIIHFRKTNELLEKKGEIE